MDLDIRISFSVILTLLAIALIFCAVKSFKTHKKIGKAVGLLEIAILLLLTYISTQYVLNLIFKRGIMFAIKDGVFTWGKVKLTYTDTLRIPKWYTGVAVPLGFGLSLLYSVVAFLRDRLHILKPRVEDKPVEIEEGGTY